ncbi:MAG: LPXTG cell wall anchor domain-containing protein [Anaerolineaceae bacterium]|jgi:LPXTG-motif cell wall-anchored protein
MSEFNDNQFEEFEEEPQANTGPTRPGGNRNFILAIGILGAIALLTLIVLIVLGLVILPARNQQRLQQAAMINAANTATSQAATQLAQIQQIKLSATMTASPTPVPSATPVVAIATSTQAPPTATLSGPVSAQDLSARTQTVAVLLTQAAGGNKTPTATTTALPTTGFADEVGLPALIGLAVLLVVVIFLVRRMRLSSSS